MMPTSREEQAYSDFLSTEGPDFAPEERVGGHLAKDVIRHAFMAGMMHGSLTPPSPKAREVVLFVRHGGGCTHVVQHSGTNREISPEVDRLFGEVVGLLRRQDG